MNADEILDQGSPGFASSNNKMHAPIKVSRKLSTCFVKGFGFLNFVGTPFEQNFLDSHLEDQKKTCWQMNPLV